VSWKDTDGREITQQLDALAKIVSNTGEDLPGRKHRHYHLIARDHHINESGDCSPLLVIRMSIATSFFLQLQLVAHHSDFNFCVLLCLTLFQRDAESDRDFGTEAVSNANGTSSTYLCHFHPTRSPLAEISRGQLGV